MSSDPFAPPEAELDSPVAHAPVTNHQLADRGRRLAGAVIDNALYLAVCVPGVAAATLVGRSVDGDTAGGAGVIAIFVPLLALYGYQMYRVTTRGQSIAKGWLSMRIVRSNGAPVELVHGVILRSWVLSLASAIPFVGGLISLADALCIFGESHQCLHDMIADTQVIDVASRP